jgi:hypothetical protein
MAFLEVRRMNDFIFNIIPAQGPSIPPWVPLLGDFPINSPLVGSFFGVLAAFGINYAYQLYKNYKDKANNIDMIRSEIQNCINILEQDKVQSLQEDKWRSVVNSGALKLFKIETELQSLSKIYHKIHYFNEIAIAERFNGNKWELLEEYKGRGRNIELLLELRHSLPNELRELMNEEWMTTKH